MGYNPRGCKESDMMEATLARMHADTGSRHETTYRVWPLVSVLDASQPGCRPDVLSLWR